MLNFSSEDLRIDLQYFTILEHWTKFAQWLTWEFQNKRIKQTNTEPT